MLNRNVLRYIAISITLFSAIIFHATTTFAQHPCDNYPVTDCNIPSSFMNWSLQDNNTLGTAQVGEPRPNTPQDTTTLNTLWYSWTPTTSGTYVVNTQFTNTILNTITFDTEIAVYRGNGGFLNLTKIARNDDWVTGDSNCYPTIPRPATEVANSSCARFSVVAGEKLYFQVDGYKDTSTMNCTGCGVGPFYLNVYFLAAPTAANVSINGKVTNENGRGISRTIVSLTDINGNIRTATTNPFGYYRFADIEAGQNYTLVANRKGYQFGNNPRVINVSDNIEGENFVGSNPFLKRE